MTCIVGLTDGKRIVLGGDSAGSSPNLPELYNVDISKVFQIGEYLVGICGSYRAGQIARWEMDWPDPPAPGTDLEPFVVREIVKRLRLKLQEAGSEVEGAQFLIGLRGQLFSIGSDFAAVRLKEPWIAIGSGRHVAYGALHALADLELDLEQKALRALRAAQLYTANVREPFHLLGLGGDRPTVEAATVEAA